MGDAVVPARRLTLRKNQAGAAIVDHLILHGDISIMPEIVENMAPGQRGTPAGTALDAAAR